MESDRMQEKYNDRLKKIIGKKFDTTMIYPLSQFEEMFGELWGDKLPEESLTEEQKKNRIKWKKCRDSILNQGNTQKRNANTEISQHQVVWKRYESVLVPVVNGNKK